MTYFELCICATALSYVVAMLYFHGYHLEAVTLFSRAFSLFSSIQF